MKPTIRVTVEGGVVQAVEYFPGSGSNIVDDAPTVQVWDFDCEGDGGNCKNSKGEEFNLNVWTPEPISLGDLQCEEIKREE
jgi:hypothetical protein